MSEEKKDFNLSWNSENVEANETASMFSLNNDQVAGDISSAQQPSYVPPVQPPVQPQTPFTPQTPQSPYHTAMNTTPQTPFSQGQVPPQTQPVQNNNIPQFANGQPTPSGYQNGGIPGQPVQPNLPPNMGNFTNQQGYFRPQEVKKPKPIWWILSIFVILLGIAVSIFSAVSGAGNALNTTKLTERFEYTTSTTFEDSILVSGLEAKQDYYILVEMSEEDESAAYHDVTIYINDETQYSDAFKDSTKSIDREEGDGYLVVGQFTATGTIVDAAVEVDGLPVDFYIVNANEYDAKASEYATKENTSILIFIIGIFIGFIGFILFIIALSIYLINRGKYKDYLKRVNM